MNAKETKMKAKYSCTIRVHNTTGDAELLVYKNNMRGSDSEWFYLEDGGEQAAIKADTVKRNPKPKTKEQEKPKWPPIKCTPCRVTVKGIRYRIYENGSVCFSMPIEEIKRTNATIGDVKAYEEQEVQSGMGLYAPSSDLAKTVRHEASRLRRNRNARERNSAMRDLGMKRTAYGWE